MFLSIHEKWKMLKKDDKGMFTIEASLIFPVIFISTIALILFSLVIYEKVVIYQKAQMIAERTAFTWDNSYKDFETGEFAENEYTTMDGGDGLYWRSNYIGEEFIRKIFSYRLTSDATGRKETRANTEGSEMFTSGNVVVSRADSMGFDRKVDVTVSGNLNFPDFLGFVVSDNFEVTASASIKDPVELIRTTDFIVHYGKEIIGAVVDR
ncbi:hypothetical protein SAMN04487943_11087 [Gracilibacillus orientalis]|uniref:TadE-like protein n=1 Tax=Gracilibacillus orientalis TaxID=334253 RepID=A0A1I4P600_9BACI|nr:hypothetical protein [Gracilibacillus orientalis]SFM23000.1 hypothetical protein SAMN04487943_11087 [Gracilibacillus orientalis]